MDVEREGKEESRITKFLLGAVRNLEVPFSKIRKYWETNKYCWKYDFFF